MDIHLNLSTELVDRAGLASALVFDAATPVRECVAAMQRDEKGCALVCQDGKLVGIFTERDALRLMAAGADWNAAMETVMTRNPVVLHAADTVGTAIQRMSAGKYRNLPIVNDEGQPLGLLKAAAIMHYLVEHFPKVVYTQPPVAQVAMQQREGA